MGLGRHIVKGLGCFGLSAALLCWLPWVKYSEHAMQTILHCATEPALKDQTGLYYSDCAVQVTRNNAANLEDARRLWEMSDRMARLTS